MADDTHPAALGRFTTLGYNGAQGKLTDGPIIFMGARPYQPDQSRFLTIDPIDGGCANPYTYAYGDPISHPDLSGQRSCRHRHQYWWNPTSWSAQTWIDIGEGIALIGVSVAAGGAILSAGAGAILALVGSEVSIDSIATDIVIGGGLATVGGATTGIAATMVQRSRKPCARS